MTGRRQLVRLALSMPHCEAPRAPTCVQPSVQPDPRGSAVCPRRRALALPHSRRICSADRPPTPAAACRWSRICRAHRPRQHACNPPCGRTPEVRQPARAAAPSLSRTLAGCARQPAHPRRRVSMVENLSRPPPAPTNSDRSTLDTTLNFIKCSFISSSSSQPEPLSRLTRSLQAYGTRAASQQGRTRK